MNTLEKHLNAVEKVLLALEEIASNAGHPNLIGGPKEWFVREFLRSHLPSVVEIGQGEAIDWRFESEPSRGNQYDIVLYRHDFPRIVYGGNDGAFLREGIVSTIEVKSRIHIDEFRRACNASLRLKRREYIQSPNPKRPQEPIGHIVDLTPPSISTYVIAYDGPSRFSTAASWLPKLRNELNASPEDLIDMMIILGKGAVWSLKSFPQLGGKIKNGHPDAVWAYIEQGDKNLLLLFLHMSVHMASTAQTPIDVLRYARNVAFNKVSVLK